MRTYCPALCLFPERVTVQGFEMEASAWTYAGYFPGRGDVYHFTGRSPTLPPGYSGGRYSWAEGDK